MRNLAQYPIQRNEKLAKLDELIEEAQRGDPLIGALTAAILLSVKKDVEFASDEYNQRIVREHHSASSMRSMAAQMSADITPR